MGLEHKSSSEQDIDPNMILCKLCNLSFKSPLDVEWHEVTEHDAGIEPRTIGSNCQVCDFTAISVELLDQHILANHTFACDQCTTCCQSSDALLKRMETHTINENPKHIECRYCDFKTLKKQLTYDHIECDHIEFAMLASIVTNQADSKDNFEKIKNELNNILNIIIDEHNSMRQNRCEKDEILSKMQKVLLDNEIIKQELFILRQDSLNANKSEKEQSNNQEGPKVTPHERISRRKNCTPPPQLHPHPSLAKL